MKIKHLITIFITLLIITNCKQTTDIPQTNSTTPQTGNNNGSSGNTSSEQTIEFKLADLLSAFSLIQGNETAYTAASKIEKTASPDPNLIFTEKKIISYNDKDGTFTVNVKGKKNGKNFSNKIKATGFTHPYNSVPKYITEKKLELSGAISENTKLDEFIEQTKDDLSKYVLFKVQLANNKEITLGTINSDYEFTTETKENAGKIKLHNMQYNIIYHSLNEGELTPTTEKTEITPSPTTLFINNEFEYFTKDDIFNYVKDKISDDIININSQKFASEFYAKSVITNSTPAELLNTGNNSSFDKLKQQYNSKSGQYSLNDMSVAIYLPQLNINVNDYTGSITLSYYVQTENNISENNLGKVTPKEISRNGFMKVDTDFVKNNFELILMRKGDEVEAKKYWRKKFTQNQQALLREEEGKTGTQDWFKVIKIPQISYSDTIQNTYYLTINGNKDYENSLAVLHDSFLSSTKENYKLLIKSIRAEKKRDEEKLLLIFTFFGTPPNGIDNNIEITLNPLL